MVKDVQAAFDYLVKQKNVNPNKIGIIGASIGANLGVTFAADNPGKVKAVALLSPGKTYRGVATEPAVKAYAGKMLLCATPGDAYSFESVNALLKLAPGRATLKPVSGGAHGTDMFPEHPKLIGDILTWLNQAM
jgi:dienelactone hydrolase